MSTYATAAQTEPALSRRLDPAADVRVEVVDDLAAFTDLREEWNALLAESRSDNLFLTWQWLHTWWTHLAGESRLAVAAVRQRTRLIALAPLLSMPGAAGRLGVPHFGFMATGTVGSDYLDVIVRAGAERDALPALARHLSRVVLDMRQVRLTASAATGLSRALLRTGFRVRATRTHLCPWIDLRGHSWPSYLDSLGAEHRYGFQRRLRMLEKHHGPTFERVATEARRRELLPVLFDLHRRRWSERGGSDGLQGSRVLAFHEDLSRLALERGWLRLSILWLGGRPAAAVYGFRYGEVYSFYQSGFDPHFRPLSVGLVAMGLAIRGAIEEGAAEFDLLHGAEAYKFHWARRTRRLARITAYPPGLRGTWLLRAAGTRAQAGRLWRERGSDAASAG